jgi:predicted SprT family Zn-dependent metalloprotease
MLPTLGWVENAEHAMIQNCAVDRMDLNKRRLAAYVASLEAKWSVPAIVNRVEIQFSRRLRSSLGRCILSRGIVRLNRRLLKARPALLEEVLCHELAHVVTFERHGRHCRPHGPEWAALMRAAGFEPRVRARLSHDLEVAVRAARTPRRLYEHRCPVCQAKRLARRPVPQWRCAACVAAGLEGKLVIAKRTR